MNVVFLFAVFLAAGCARGNYARDYFGASRGPVGVDVCTDFQGHITDKNYTVLKNDTVIEKYMDKQAIIRRLGQPDEISLSIAGQEIWTYPDEPITLFFDKGFLTHWKKDE